MGSIASTKNELINQATEACKSLGLLDNDEQANFFSRLFKALAAADLVRVQELMAVYKDKVEDAILPMNALAHAWGLGVWSMYSRFRIEEGCLKLAADIYKFGSNGGTIRWHLSLYLDRPAEGFTEYRRDRMVAGQERLPVPTAPQAVLDVLVEEFCKQVDRKLQCKMSQSSSGQYLFRFEKYLPEFVDIARMQVSFYRNLRLFGARLEKARRFFKPLYKLWRWHNRHAVRQYERDWLRWQKARSGAGSPLR